MPHEQNPPASKKDGPDPASSYERAKPHKEAGMGLDARDAVPVDRPDQMEKAVTNRQPSRQINADDETDDRKRVDPNRQTPAPEQPTHSMLDEEPLGWDQAPFEKKRQQDRRHPKTDGRGGTD